MLKSRMKIVLLLLAALQQTVEVNSSQAEFIRTRQIQIIPPVIETLKVGDVLNIVAVLNHTTPNQSLGDLELCLIAETTESHETELEVLKGIASEIINRLTNSSWDNVSLGLAAYQDTSYAYRLFQPLTTDWSIWEEAVLALSSPRSDEWNNTFAACEENFTLSTSHSDELNNTLAPCEEDAVLVLSTSRLQDELTVNKTVAPWDAIACATDSSYCISDNQTVIYEQDCGFSDNNESRKVLLISASSSFGIRTDQTNNQTTTLEALFYKGVSVIGLKSNNTSSDLDELANLTDGFTMAYDADGGDIVDRIMFDIQRDGSITVIPEADCPEMLKVLFGKDSKTIEMGQSLSVMEKFKVREYSNTTLSCRVKFVDVETGERIATQRVKINVQCAGLAKQCSKRKVQCCEGLHCTAGFCMATPRITTPPCKAVNAPCTKRENECCNGLLCKSITPGLGTGQCQLDYCQSLNEECTKNNLECCPGLFCRRLQARSDVGQCISSETRTSQCRSESQHCSFDHPCCKPLRCRPVTSDEKSSKSAKSSAHGGRRKCQNP